jgi:hypothetical protein
MKTPRICFVLPLAVTAISLIGSMGRAAVLLDDDWDDGDRTDTNLPEESAWFASNAISTPTLSAAVGALIGNVRIFETNAGSRLWITHFTPAGVPVELGIGDALKVTAVFTVNNVAAAPGTARGLRIGLFNFSEPGAARVSGDGFSTGSGGGAPGVNVTGYGVNMNFAQTITTASPLQIIKRTDLATNNLMGASAVFATLGAGGGASGTPGFASGVPYTFEFSVTRDASGVGILARFKDGAEWSVFHSVTDTANPTFRFDGFAIRPNSAADTADTFTFSRFKVELMPFEVRIVGAEFPSPEGFKLTWSTLPGRSYRVEWRSNLLDSVEWSPVGSVVADGSTASLSDIEAFFDPRRFYRVVELP